MATKVFLFLFCIFIITNERQETQGDILKFTSTYILPVDMLIPRK
jgi:hypothetical protein